MPRPLMHWTRRCGWLWVLLSMAVRSGPISAALTPWAAPGHAEVLHEEMRALLGEGMRLPGSPENLALEDRVARRFSASGFEHGEMAFAAQAFVPGNTRMTVDGSAVRLRPLHPSLFRPGNFRERAFETELVYAGHGTEADIQALDGIDLNDRMIVMEFNSGRNWERFLRFGARGFVFLEADRYTLRESTDKVHTSEAAVPRFFLQGEDAAYVRARLAGPGPIPVQMQAEPSRWERQPLRNLWVFIPGSDPGVTAETIVLVAPMDANSVVPELALGGQSGANLHLLMALLDQFSEEPPERSILLVAVNARTQNFLGDRVLAWYLLAIEGDIEGIRDELSADFRYQELVAGYLDGLKMAPETMGSDREILIDMRTRSDHSIGRQVTIKDPIVALSQRDVNEIKGNRLRIIRQRDELRAERNRLATAAELPEASRDLHGHRIREIDQEMAELGARETRMQKDLDSAVNVLTLFNRVGIRTTLDELTEEEVDLLRGYVETVRTRLRSSAEDNRADLVRSMENSRVREVLAGRRVQFLISLEMTWGHEQVAFASGLALGRSPWAHRWGRNVVRVAENLGPVAGGEKRNLLVDSMTNVGGLPEAYYVPGTSGAVQMYHLAQRTPAFSLNHAYTGHGRAFTPVDRLDRLDPAIVAEVQAFAAALIHAVVSDRRSVSELAPAPSLVPLWSSVIKAYKFDEFAAGVVPEIPVPDSVIMLADPTRYPSPVGDVGTGFTGPGIINKSIALTGPRATAIFYGLYQPSFASHVIRMDSDFVEVDHVVDSGETHRKASTDLTRAPSRVLSMVPVQEELVVYDRVDTPGVRASRVYVDRYYPLSADRNSEPRKYGLSGAESALSSKTHPRFQWGPVSFFAEEGDRMQMVTLSRRLALNVTDYDPDGIGFATGEELGADYFRQALRDTRKLNRLRYASFRGVTDELVEMFMARGKASEERAERAAAEHRHLDFLRAQHDGLGAQAKAYAQVMGITNDMLKAVVFYMALLLPFCFFVQKLLFKTTRIERQMGLFALLFVGCYLLFRFIHPAFAVAKAPEAMFIAFVMGGLGLFVIAILHSRFEGEMQLLFSQLTGHDDTEVGYSMVSQQAMLIGVNNMKRRRIRTLLTTATIVLVTFTMLAFTSVSRRMSPTMISRSDTAPYTGFMYHWPGGQTMDDGSFRTIHELIEGEDARVTRRWLMPETVQDQRGVFRLTHPARESVALIDGALGLEPAEHGFLSPMPMVEGRFFEVGDAEEIIITADLASYLDIESAEVGETFLNFGGRSLRLVGIMDGDHLRSIEDLNGFPMLPIEQLIDPTLGVGAEAEEALDDESGIFFLSTLRMIILPAETARSLGAAPYSISVRYPDDTSIWPVIDRFLTATSARFFIASRRPFSLSEDEEGRAQQPGTYFIGAGYRTAIGGLAMLIIPLLIASTIILNTMLGSVFERKKEIAVFNAVGLNPTHIGLFFLAESFVYGIIGSVGGYLIGQVLSIVLNTFGWVEDINLNFSSLSVAYVIVFTVSIVLLSTLYPAAVATKAAVPSGKRKWSMPDHDGQTMRVAFPFIYQPDLVAGVMHYLARHMGQFDEASVGDLIAERTAVETGRDARERATYRITYQVALAPFDLGVTQSVTFDAAYDDQVGAYRVTMTNERMSGQDSNWVSTNKPFLEQLRKYLLYWRNLSSAEHALNVERGNVLFVEGCDGHET